MSRDVVRGVVWSGLVYYRGRVTPLRVRSWVGAAPLQRHPTVLNSQPGRALNAEVTAQRTWAFSPHSTLVVLTCCSRSRSLSLFCLSVRARGCGRRGAVRRAVLPTSPSAGCHRPTPPPRRCCCRCCRRRCCRCRWWRCCCCCARSCERVTPPPSTQ